MPKANRLGMCFGPDQTPVNHENTANDGTTFYLCTLIINLINTCQQ